jgi:membrane-associated phospholipid phosphatase
MSGAGGTAMPGAHPWRAGLATRTAWLLAGVIVFAGLPMLADKWVYDHFWLPNIYDRDWARLLRVMGFLPTWLIAAYTMWLQGREGDRARSARRVWYLVLAPTAAGLGCEILKLLLRRERPEANGGLYVFRLWSDQTFSTAGLAFPSSHTMVAFGAATALARLYPKANWVWFALAAGCGVTRVLSRAHFLSDATFGALMGWCIGWGVWFVMHKRGEI